MRSMNRCAKCRQAMSSSPFVDTRIIEIGIACSYCWGAQNRKSSAQPAKTGTTSGGGSESTSLHSSIKFVRRITCRSSGPSCRTSIPRYKRTATESNPSTSPNHLWCLPNIGCVDRERGNSPSQDGHGRRNRPTMCSAAAADLDPGNTGSKRRLR
jgi:hypothetical protein